MRPEESHSAILDFCVLLVVPVRGEAHDGLADCRRHSAPARPVERNAHGFAAFRLGESRKALGGLKKSRGGLETGLVRHASDLGECKSGLVGTDADLFHSDEARFQSAEDLRRLEEVRGGLKKAHVRLEKAGAQSDASRFQSAEAGVGLKKVRGRLKNARGGLAEAEFQSAEAKYQSRP
jgi:hypothetical protein